MVCVFVWHVSYDDKCLLQSAVFVSLSLIFCRLNKRQGKEKQSTADRSIAKKYFHFLCVYKRINKRYCHLHNRKKCTTDGVTYQICELYHCTL
uniref:Uncharacterized protein n=1 Tax=Lepeophtheirus salmonis TaxID=72036 RepID=A0A0K2TTW9_LEPSM